MTEPQFDELIHSPTRLSIVSLLAASDWAEFKFIRDSVGLSDSALSKQLALLEEAGYVQIRKAFVGKRPRTWARLGNTGRRAFEGHVARLQEIVNQAGVSITPNRSLQPAAVRPDDPSAEKSETSAHSARSAYGLSPSGGD
jgi:DNA-binding transcriptional ArsR family regulator